MDKGPMLATSPMKFSVVNAKELTMFALASSKISDDDARAAAKSLDIPDAMRPALWRKRWDNSTALQTEFADAVGYSTYMEGRLTGQIRVIQPKAKSEAQQSDARLRSLARATGWSEAQRRENWNSFYQDCASVQAEFSSAEDYVALMENEFSRGR